MKGKLFNMGCTQDYIEIRTKNKQTMINFIQTFNKVLKDTFANEDFMVLENDIKREIDVYSLEIDGEPLFYDIDFDNDKILKCLEIFIPKHLKDFIYIEHLITFTNGGDTYQNIYSYHKNELVVTNKYIDYGMLGECENCEEEIEGMWTIDDFSSTEPIICPNCGEVIDAHYQETISIIKY